MSKKAKIINGTMVFYLGSIAGLKPTEIEVKNLQRDKPKSLIHYEKGIDCVGREVYHIYRGAIFN